MIYLRGVRRSAVVFVLLMLGTLSTTAGGASAAGWLAPQNVSLSVSDLGFDKDGNAIAVGVGAGAGGVATIRAMTRPPGGQWSAPVPVSGSDDSDPAAPHVAVDPDGNAVAVWSAVNAGERVVQAASRPAGGAWSDPVEISGGGDVLSGNDEVAIDAHGNATAIWAEFSASVSPSDYVVRSARLPSGGNWSGPTDLSDGGGALSDPVLAVDPQGGVTAVWIGLAGVVRSNSRPAAGEWGSAVDLSTTGVAQVAQVVVDPQGIATAIWDSGDVVRSARRVSGSWSTAVVVGSGNSPQVAVDAQGKATAVWRSVTPSSAIKRSTSTAGGPWSDPIEMATGTDADDVGYPWVAVDPQGGVTVIWARLSSSILLAQATHRTAAGDWSPVADLSVGQPITAIPAAGVDPQGHTTLIWSSSENPWAGSSSVFDSVGPELRNLTIPGTAFVGQPVAMSVDPFDTWSSVKTYWDFGDVQFAMGTAVDHTYKAEGTRTVTVTGFDALGNMTRASQTVSIGRFIVDPPFPPPPPPPKPEPGPGNPAPAPKAPVLSGLQQSNSRWLTHKAKRGPRLPVGTTFRFRLDRAAQVRFAFSQLVTGRRVGGRCVKATKSNRPKPRCDRAQTAGTLNVTGKAGANTVAFSGKISGRALKPGRYRVLVTALADGKTSPARAIRFTIAR